MTHLNIFYSGRSVKCYTWCNYLDRFSSDDHPSSDSGFPDGVTHPRRWWSEWICESQNKLKDFIIVSLFFFLWELMFEKINFRINEKVKINRRYEKNPQPKRKKTSPCVLYLFLPLIGLVERIKEQYSKWFIGVVFFMLFLPIRQLVISNVDDLPDYTIIFRIKKNLLVVQRIKRKLRQKSNIIKSK